MKTSLDSAVIRDHVVHVPATPWTPLTFEQALDQTVARWPGAEALVIEGSRIDWTGLRAQAQAVARALRAL